MQPKKDVQTVTPGGKPLRRLIEGVQLRGATTHPDDRGTLCEVYNTAWGFHEAPLVYVYTVIIRPGKVKGWVVHHKQDDRIFVNHGIIRVVLYDDRAESPTHKMVNEIYLGEVNRALFTIPRGVYHALQNVGNVDAEFMNLPTRAYDHADPDKYRLPLKNDLIPYKFEEKSDG